MILTTKVCEKRPLRCDVGHRLTSQKEFCGKTFLESACGGIVMVYRKFQKVCEHKSTHMQPSIHCGNVSDS